MSTLKEIDLTGLKCPMPIVELTKLLKQLLPGESFNVVADDPAFCLDVEAWCRKTGNSLLQLDSSSERISATIRKN